MKWHHMKPLNAVTLRGHKKLIWWCLCDYENEAYKLKNYDLMKWHHMKGLIMNSLWKIIKASFCDVFAIIKIISWSSHYMTTHHLRSSVFHSVRSPCYVICEEGMSELVNYITIIAIECRLHLQLTPWEPVMNKRHYYS
jgi:hypothetical protein